ncbi:MAG: hypothetical protein EG828_06620 [Deltaproteobacteria bacterium]|nr:hypothetical protein [Deltaproteobacteria bacterium]
MNKVRIEILVIIIMVLVAASVCLLIKPTDIWSVVIAVGTISYTFITWRILSSANRHNNYSTLYNLYVQLKNDYNNIGLQNTTIGLQAARVSYTGYAALLKELPSGLDLRTLEKHLKEHTLKDFHFVSFEFLHLIDRIDQYDLDERDRNSIVAMLSNFYSQRMEQFIITILSHEPSISNKDDIRIFKSLQARMAPFKVQDAINQYFSKLLDSFLGMFGGNR